MKVFGFEKRKKYIQAHNSFCDFISFKINGHCLLLKIMRASRNLQCQPEVCRGGVKNEKVIANAKGSAQIFYQSSFSRPIRGEMILRRKRGWYISPSRVDAVEALAKLKKIGREREKKPFSCVGYFLLLFSFSLVD